jgi:hypothetical protein
MGVQDCQKKKTKKTKKQQQQQLFLTRHIIKS